MQETSDLLPSHLTINTDSDVDRYLGLIQSSARRSHEWLISQSFDSIELFRLLKFGSVGFHPIDDRAINLVEQINQTWSYIAALVAARLLLKMHPDGDGFRLAPGAHASLELDIMSVRPGFVGAEVFAAVDPRNNRKLLSDIAKLKKRDEKHRYVCFMSPKYPMTGHQPELDPAQDDDRIPVQVWSVHF